MKTAWIFALLAIIGIGIVGYVLTSQSAIDWEKLRHSYSIDQNTTQAELATFLTETYQRGQLNQYLEQKSIVALCAGVFLLVAGVVISLHLVIDKLFYCKYYEQPDLVRAVIRGTLWASLPLVVIYLGIWHYLNPEIALLAMLLFVFLEVLTQNIYKNFHKKIPVPEPEQPEKIV